MDSNRFHEALKRLQALDEMSTYKIRPRAGSMSRVNIEQLEERHRELAHYTIALKEILHELFQAIAGQPAESPQEK